MRENSRDKMPMANGSELQIGPPADGDEVHTFARIAAKALFAPDTDADAWMQEEGWENIRVARKHGQVVGGLSVQKMGQWFGGRAIPMTAVRVVAVASEHRSAGVASRLVREALNETHQAGIPLSTLFPATQPVYRRAGYEQAGQYLLYRLPTRGIDVRDRELALRPIEPSDHEAVKQAYANRARGTSGNLDRGTWMWRRILEPPSWRHQADGYLVERDGRVEGYVVVVQRIVDPIRHVHELQIEDLVILTADAGRRLLTFFADHRSMAEGVTFRGAPAEPLLYLLAEQEGKIIHRMDWMLRIVDVPGALKARGYPPGLTAEVHLDVRDDVLPHNHGRFVLQVADSHASVHEGGNGTFRVDVRGLAAMYSGHLSPTELRAAGHLDGPDEDLATATAIFASPTPWMPDIF